MPDPFEQVNPGDSISGIQESPNEFSHSTKIASVNELGHVRGGGNVVIDQFGNMTAPTSVGACEWDQISGKPVKFPPLNHVHPSDSLFKSSEGNNSITAKTHESLSLGNYAFSVGRFSQADGLNSVALGQQNNASADNSISIGSDNINLGAGSVSIGRKSFISPDAVNSTVFGVNNRQEASNSYIHGTDNQSIGDMSSLWGFRNKSHDFNETVFGQYAKISTGKTSSHEETNKALVIGNGVDDNDRSNAFDIAFNGEVYNSGSQKMGNNSILYNNRMRAMSFGLAQGQKAELLLYINNIDSAETQLFLDEEKKNLIFPNNTMVSMKIKVVGISIYGGKSSVINIEQLFLVDDRGRVSFEYSKEEIITNRLEITVMTKGPGEAFGIMVSGGVDTANYVAHLEWLEVANMRNFHGF